MRLFSAHRFLDAAKSGDEDAAASSLATRPELVTSTTLLQRKTALHLAAEEGHLQVLASIVETLLCQVSTPEEGGASSSFEDAQALVGEVINSKDAEGRTPLVIACGHGHVQCARWVS